MSYSTLFNSGSSLNIYTVILVSNNILYSIYTTYLDSSYSSYLYSYNITTQTNTLFNTFSNIWITGAVINNDGSIIYYVNRSNPNSSNIVAFNTNTNVSTNLVTFTGISGLYPGNNPLVSPILYNNILYGTCNEGGVNDKGVIYSYNITTSVYKYYSLPYQPTIASLTLNSSNNILYGSINDPPSIFTIDTDLIALNTINNTNVQSQTNTLYYNITNNKLYGTSQFPSTSPNIGSLFCLDNDGGNYTTIYSFLNNNPFGYNPLSNIELYDNKLYFTTRGGIDPSYSGAIYGTLLSIPSNTIIPIVPTLEYTFNSTNSNPVNIINLSNIIYGYAISDLPPYNTPAVVYSYTLVPICFNQNARILCLNDKLIEEYISIKKIKKGTMVKTYKHGYRRVDLIGKKTMKNDPSSLLNCMYRLKSNDLEMPDLIVTGLHSICVDNISEKELSKFKEYRMEIGKIDDKYLVHACISDKFEKIINRNIYTYYHLTLENDGNENAQYAIMANGVLTETTCENNFKRTGFTLTN